MLFGISDAAPTTSLVGTQHESARTVGNPIELSSSDDSSNSEAEDWRLITQEPVAHATPRNYKRRKRRSWNPGRERSSRTSETGVEVSVEEILSRGFFQEQYIGDRGDAPTTDLSKHLRIASANINKGVLRKVDGEITTWFIANRLDFMIIADTGLTCATTKTIWVTVTDGSKMPGLTLIGNKRAGILMDSERWQGRLIKQDTKLSPSGRSISITVRLGRRAELVLVATYLPGTPQANTTATKQEREWIGTRIELAQQRGQILIVGGDFNAYPDGGLDRQGPGAQAVGTRRQNEYFKQWTEMNGLVSTFKQRHPRTPRFTYTNGGTSTALDDIYICSQQVHQVEQSGIWLYSLNRGDHVGTPFVSLALSQLQETRRHLKGVKSIRHVDTKKKTPEEMMEYTHTLSGMLATGKLSLIDSIDVANSSEEVIKTWLHDSVDNVYKCMYSAAKHLWGEKSQARKVIDRAVSKKRTARCHGQFKAIARMSKMQDATEANITSAFKRIQWPKWIVDPARLPTICPHKATATALDTWRRSCRPDGLPNLIAWLDRGYHLWRQAVRARTDWRHRRKLEINCEKREFWFKNGGTRRFLRDVLGPSLPPVSIRPRKK